MSKGIRTYPAHQHPTVVQRRLKSQSKGIGYWAAIDYQQKVMTSASLAQNYVAK